MKRLLSTCYILLFATTTLLAQARFSSDIETYDFGQIEWKHPVTAQYTITNTGDKPLVLSEVIPDCACSVAHWTQTPIAPGTTGTVHVTFDAEALGYFQKSVAIISNAQTIVYLHFKGQVVREIKDFTRTHPFQIGDIRIDRTTIEFPDTPQGTNPQLHIGVANLSGRPYEPVLMHLPAYVEMEVKPNILQQGEKGTITLTLCTERLNDIGLTEAQVYLSRFAGDKVSEENCLPLTAIILPDFSTLSEAQRANAPSIHLSATELDLSQQLSKKNKARADVTISNSGSSLLKINKLQTLDPAIELSLKKNTLQPSEKVRLRITVNKKHLNKQQDSLRLLLITNDPASPKVEIKIKK
ncbi:MAG: DUF1573 domain-containing protein [Mediterranea massiliensis]|nr:DUF1573 domain-containing protein [Mediterranea massiliensis]